MRPAGSLSLLLLLAGGPAWAGGLALSWSAPPECPSVEQIELGVAEILGRPIAELAPSWSSVEASIAPVGAEWELRVAVVRRDGVSSERRLRGATCQEAGEAAVVVLATSLTPRASNTFSAGSAGTRATPADEGAPIASEDTAPTLRRPPPNADSTPGLAHESRSPDSLPAPGFEPPLRLSVQLGLDSSLMAGASSAGEVGVRYELPQLGFQGFFGGLPGRGLALEPRGSAELSLWFAGGMSCYGRFRSAPVALQSGTQRPAMAAFLCVGAEFGEMSARGVGIAGAREDSAFWFALRVQGSAAWNVTQHLALVGSVQALAPLRSLHVVVNPAEVHETPSLSLRGLLGLDVGF